MDYADFETKHPGPEDLKNARRSARLTQDEAAKLCGLHRTSYQRQERGESRVNVAAFRLLLMRAGWLPDPFDGWSIGQGALWSPEDVRYEPGEIRALPYLHALIAELKRKLREYEPERANEKSHHPANVIPFPGSIKGDY